MVDMLSNGCVSTGHKFSNYGMCTICGEYSSYEPNEETKAAILEAYGSSTNDYEVFIIDKDHNNILSLHKDNVYFFNTTNFNADDFLALMNNDIDHIINKGLALRLDSEIIHRMYLGFVNKTVCAECKKRVGDNEKSDGFGSVSA